MRKAFPKRLPEVVRIGAVRLRVLGYCEVEFEGRTTRFRHKAAELLGLLAVRRRPLTRAELAAILWPDAFDSDARHNLRQTLLTIRGRLQPGDLLLSDTTSVSLSPQTEVDLWDREARWAAAPSPEELQDRQPLLAPLFADWILAQRAEYGRRRVEIALREGGEALAHDPKRSLSFARLAIQISPDLQAPRDLAVRAFVALGDSAGALREIAEFETLLSEEFGRSVPHRLREHLKPASSLALASADLHELNSKETLEFVLSAVPALAARPAEARNILRDTLERAIDLLPEDRARAEITLARLAMAIGDIHEAEAAADRGRDFAQTELTRAEANTVRGRILVQTNRLNEAWAVLQAARDVVVRLNAPGLLADIDGALGASLLAEHRTKEADAFFRSALSAAERAGNKARIARIVQNRAVAMMYAGRLDAAASEVERFLPMAPPSYKAKLSMHLGRIREAQGRREEAERAYTDAIFSLRQQEEPYFLAQALTYAADASLAGENLPTARTSYEEAIMLRRTIGDRLGLMSAYKGLGMVAHREGKLNEAEASLREALRFSIEIGEPMAGASVRLALARVYADAGRIGEALDEARRARRGILGLRAEAASLTTDDTLSLQAAENLVKRLESALADTQPGINTGFLTEK